MRQPDIVNTIRKIPVDYPSNRTWEVGAMRIIDTAISTAPIMANNGLYLSLKFEFAQNNKTAFIYLDKGGEKINYWWWIIKKDGRPHKLTISQIKAFCRELVEIVERYKKT